MLLLGWRKGKAVTYKKVIEERSVKRDKEGIRTMRTQPRGGMSKRCPAYCRQKTKTREKAVGRHGQSKERGAGGKKVGG